MSGKRTALPSVDALFGPPAPRLAPEGVNAPVREYPNARIPADGNGSTHEPPPAAIPASTQARAPERTHTVVAAPPPARTPAGTIAGIRSSPQGTLSKPRDKFTFRFDEATLQDLERAWSAMRLATGKRIRKSWIVEAAVRYVIRDADRAQAILHQEMAEHVK